jgi:hypothetical protein
MTSAVLLWYLLLQIKKVKQKFENEKPKMEIIGIAKNGN